MLTDVFSYRLGDNGVILNPTNLVPPFVDITEITGLDNAPYRTTERDHEGTDGGYMDAMYEKGRTITLEGMAYSSVHEQVTPFLDQLKADFAPSRVPVPFYYLEPGVPERLLFVKPLGARYDIAEMRRVGCTEIKFEMFAEDPRIYTAEAQVVQIPQTTTGTSGRFYNRSYPYGYGGSTAISGQVNLINEGNRTTPVVFSIPGPASNPAIINDTIGLTMTFTITLGDDDVLVVDTRNHTVLLNGQNRRSALDAPTWFLLQEGDNYIRYRSDLAGSGVPTATFRSAWR